MSVVIVDTGVANRHSIQNAFDYIGVPAKISASAADILAADKLVLPGVGAFAAGMAALAQRNLAAPLTEAVLVQRKPILGVCLGMQLMAEESEEGGQHRGLGWIPGRVVRLRPKDQALKIPHVGFNSVKLRSDSRLFRGLPPVLDFYFVHSYKLACPENLCVGLCEYGEPFVAAIENGNIFATQFHLEKSQSAGLTVLKNFAAAG